MTRNRNGSLKIQVERLKLFPALEMLVEYELPVSA